MPETSPESSPGSPVPFPTDLPVSSALSGAPVAAAAVRPPARHWLTVLTLVLLGAVVYLQRPEPPDPKEAAAAKLAETVEAPESSAFILLGKVLLGWRDAVPNMADLIRAQTDQSGFGKASSADELRVAMLLIATNSTRPGAASGFAIPGLEPPPSRKLGAVLDEVEAAVAPDSPLREDIAAVRPLLDEAERPGADEQSIRAAVDALTPEARAGLKQRHGWFAEVLFTTGDKNAPVRVEGAGQGVLLGLLVTALGFGILLAIVIGLVLLVLGIVWKASGRIRWSFAPGQRWSPELASDPRRVWARGLWLETVAVFLAGFLGLKLLGDAAHALLPKQRGLIWLSLLGQWSLLACIFWPVARGLSWEEWREQIGWRAPKGPGTVWREIGAGFCAYIAGLPIYFAMAIVVATLMFTIEKIKKAMGAPPGPPPSNRITEIIGGGGTAVLVTVFLLATVWAPIVEESIFRGALYRHLRGRFGLLGAGFLSAAAFAVMHGYVAVQLLMVFTLGAVFAVMREWRNSVIPSATAHFMHNAFAMTVMLIAAWFMKA